ncbi:uncharacterized protein [Miscanthus floridulus]|uniref:uncharacterized protein n=1 Tax=Miscanthus floridulus TaxID=154761 RepID=UPI00345AD21D
MADDTVVIGADPWDPSDVTVEMLQSLIDSGLLRPVTDPNRPEWIAPSGEPEPRPRDGYVVSFVSFHKRSLSVSVDRFMRALPHYYGVELHNFNPNSIVRETVDAKLRSGGLTTLAMRPSWGYLSLGMRDVRPSPPPVPEDARRRAINRAHAEAQKKRKDAKAAKRMKQILAREKLDERRRQQRKDGLSLEESPSSSLSTNALDRDDEGEMGRGPLDHLPDVEETTPGASASSPALPRGGGADPGSAIACLWAETDTPEERALGKRAVNPVGSTAAVVQVAAEATQLLPRRTEEAPGSIEDRPAPMDMEAVLLPPPPPLQTRVAVSKRLLPRSSQKQPAEVPSLAPLKALKANPGFTAHWVAEAHATLQRGAASVRVDPKEPATHRGAAESVLTRTGEGSSPPHEGEVHESDGAEAPSVAEATEVEAPRVSEAKAMEDEAPRTAEDATAAVGAPAPTEATMAEAGAPGTTEAVVIAARPLAPELETEATVASVAPLVQVYPVSSDETSQGREAVDAEVAAAMEQLVPSSVKGSSALMRVRPEPHGWDHPRVRWQSRDDPEGEPLFALKDAVEGGRWDTFEQYRQLAERSLWMALSVVADDLPRVAQDKLQRQKGLLAGANELLATRSAEVEDLRLRCFDAKVEAAVAQEQVAPLAARVKELEEELTHVVELGSEASKAAEAARVEAQHLKEKAKASRVEAQRWKEKAEASQAEAQRWGQKVEELEKEVTQAAKASGAVQAVLDTEIGEHDALKSAIRTACEALEVEGIQSGSSLRSRLVALSDQVRERLRGALHTGVKRALAVIALHYVGVDLQAISDGYILPDDDEEADEAVMKLMEATEGPGAALAGLFEEEVVPPPPSADAGDPAP